MEFFTSHDWLNRGLSSYAFQWDHILFVVLMLAIGIFLAIFLRNKKKSTIKIVLIVLWALGLALEISYYTYNYVMCATDPANYPFKLDSKLPLHSCLMFFYLFPFAIFAKNKTIKLAASNFVVIVNMIMGFITLFVGCPSAGYAALSFDGVQILTYHGIIVITPLIMVVTNYYDLKKNDWMYGLSLFAILSTFIWVFDAAFGCDYFFFYDGHVFPAFKFISENVHHLVWTLIVVSCYVITAFATHFLIVGIKYLIHREKAPHKSNYYNLEKNRKKPAYRIARFLNYVIFRKPKFNFTKEQLPDEPVLFLSNHVGKKAPSKIELYYPRDFRMWGAHENTEGFKSIHRYLTFTYYYQKKHLPRWFAWFVGTIVSPFVYAQMLGMRVIPTYRDQNFYTTLKLSVKEFEEGRDIVIYPEDSENGYNEEIERFFSGFVSLLEVLHRKGHDVPIFVAYFNKKTNSFNISELIRYSSLKETYSSNDEVADALRIKMNSLREIH